MKKQIVATINKIALLATLAFALGIAPAFLVPKTALAAPAKCYTTTGPLQVAPTTASCSVDPSGRISYSDLSGQPVDTPAENACYTGEPASGSGSFVSRSFREQNCADLEALRAVSLQSHCETSDGVWAPGASGQQGSCACSGNLTYSNGICQSQASASPSSSNNVPKAQGPEECQSENNRCCEGASGDLTAENCDIVGLLNTIFNFVSGGIALAVIGNIIYAGIQYSMAQGDPSAVTKSKNRIRGALLAFLIYLVLYAFLQWLIPGGVFFA